MKLALNTLGCPDWSLERLVSEAKRLGCSGIEIRGIQNEMDPDNIPWFSEEGAPRFNSFMECSGITPICLGSSVSLHDQDTLCKSLAEAKKYIRIANRCRIPSVRVFGNNVNNEENEKETLDRVSFSIRELCRYSEINTSLNGRPVQILLEAHGDFNILSRLYYVAEKVDRSSFGIIWDIAHVDRAHGDEFHEFYTTLRDYIRHLHIKDHKRTDNGFVLTSVGNGDIPIKEIVNTLASDGFDGYLSLETEKKWHPELPDPENEFPHFVEYIRSLTE